MHIGARRMLAACVLLLAFASQAAAQAEPEAGRSLLFQDEFQSFEIWNGQRGWNVTGGPQWKGRIIRPGTMPFNYEIGWYADPTWELAKVNPFVLRNGKLAIRATPDEQVNYFDRFPYTSGMINSFRAFRHRYGYFEMRAKLARGRGFVPAFWLLPADSSYGEIDIMEILGSNTKELYTTVHSYSTGRLVSTGKKTVIPDAAESFHTYGVDWQRDYITWYFDGERIFRAKTPDDLHRPVYMILNLAVGGNWPGLPADGHSSSLTVDYIRVYSRK